MPRIRTIKPEFPQSESMGRLSRDARLLFVQMWTLADDSGRLRGNSRMLASLLFPYDDDAPSLIDGWISELEREGCVVRYIAENQTYIEICKWLIHQKIDKPSLSKIPKFNESSRILANPREHSPLDQGSKDLRIKDQGLKEKVQKEKITKPAAIECPSDVDENVWLDWLALRKTKKAPVTPTVINHARKESEKAGVTLEYFLKIWCARGSQGLEASWLKPEERPGSKLQSRAEVANFMFRSLKEGGDERPEIFDITPE